MIGLAACRDCGKPIRWTVTVAGKRLAVNPIPDEDGNTAVYRDGTGRWLSRRPSDELPITGWERLHMPHVATCTAQQQLPLPAGVTDLNAHRRRKGGR